VANIFGKRDVYILLKKICFNSRWNICDY